MSLCNNSTQQAPLRELNPLAAYLLKSTTHPMTCLKAATGFTACKPPDSSKRQVQYTTPITSAYANTRHHTNAVGSDEIRVVASWNHRHLRTLGQLTNRKWS